MSRGMTGSREDLLTRYPNLQHPHDSPPRISYNSHRGKAPHRSGRRLDAPIHMHISPVHSFRRMPSGIWVLGFVSLLMDISSEMIHSLLPLFMVTTLGAGTVAVGIVEGLAEVPRTPGQNLFGRPQRLCGAAKTAGPVRIWIGRVDQAAVRVGSGHR